MNQSLVLSFALPTLAELDRLAMVLATTMVSPVTFALIGELGAGKTAFVQALAKAYGMTEGVVSPTFTLMNHYSLNNGKTLIHSDLYRLNDEQESAELGLSDYYDDPSAVVAIEWADRFPGLMPDHALWCRFIMSGDRRVCMIEGLTMDQFLVLEKKISETT